MILVCDPDDPPQQVLELPERDELARSGGPRLFVVSEAHASAELEPVGQDLAASRAMFR
jgi:hypothetical protein